MAAMRDGTDKSLRIAIVTGSLSGHAGGGPRSTAIHATALQTAGIGVTIFTGFNRKYPLTPDHFNLRNCEIVSSRLIGPTVLGLAIGALWTLFHRAREFDVIHMNGHWNLTTFLAARIARVRGIPYVITTRGHLGTYDFARYPLLKFLLYHFMEKSNIRHAALMHVCSDWELRDSKRALADARVVKLPNALDLTGLLPPLQRQDARRDLDLPQDQFIVLFLGRIAIEKSPFLLLDAWQAASLPDTAQLVLAGPCDAGLKHRLNRKIRNQDLRGVRFVDYVSGEVKKAWLAATDLFVLPSTDDSFSVAVIEAAATGTSCLVSPFVGATEYLPAEIVVVAPLNSGAWATSLSRHSASPRPQEPVPPEALDLFRPQSVGAKWRDIYGSLREKASPIEP